MVTVGGEVSSTQYITLGTPQGSRLSALLFTILLADIDLWTDQSLLSNFADDTQSIIVGYNLEEVINITRNEANNVIDFFESNNLVNNALLCNSKGKKKNISIANNGGDTDIRFFNIVGRNCCLVDYPTSYLLGWHVVVKSKALFLKIAYLFQSFKLLFELKL